MLEKTDLIKVTGFEPLYRYIAPSPIGQPRVRRAGNCVDSLKSQKNREVFMNWKMTRRTTMGSFFCGILISGLAVASVNADSHQSPEPLGIAMENYDYPHPVDFLDLKIQGKRARMAYMDVRPSEESNDQAVMLMHGKNFFGAYWKKTIAHLADQGYRVVVPDQIGFGKSSKPNIHYSFQLLAQNSKQLLEKLEVDEVAVVGHSMGGMLATRFALMYPERTSHLILENPIGLEDYRRKVDFQSIEETYKKILNYTKEGLIEYHKSYYAEWKEAYRRFPMIHYRWTLSGEYPRLAWASALTYEMIYTQPVVHQLPDVKVPTLLVIGQEDRTSLGSGPNLGQYPELGKKAAEAIPDATLVELDGIGHLPHLEATDHFHQALTAFIQPD